MTIIHLDRGGIVRTTPAILCCLWENVDIYDAIIGHRWKVKKLAEGVWLATFWLTQVEIKIVSRRRDGRSGIFHALFTTAVLGVPLSLMLTAEYVMTVEGDTAGRCFAEFRIGGLAGLFAKFFQSKLQRLADDVFLTGFDAAQLVKENFGEVKQNLTSEQQQTLSKYLADPILTQSSKENFPRDVVLEIIPIEQEDIVRMETSVPRRRKSDEKTQGRKKHGSILASVQKLLPLAEQLRAWEVDRPSGNRSSPTQIGNRFYTEAKKIGKSLYDFYIPRNSHAYLTSMLDSGVKTHLRIIAQGRNSLLPWELLHNGDDFLFAVAGIARRSMNVTKAVYEKPIELGGILIVSSNPRNDLDKVNEEAETLARDISGHVRGIKVKRLFGSEARKENIVGELETGKYQILHFCGHSEYRPKDPGQSCLFLFEQSELIADELARLSTEGSLHLVFLNSCSSGVSSGVDSGTLGLADSFVKKGVPFVLGMMWRITDRGGSLLAVEFYKAFMETRDPMEALSRARMVVGSILDWQDPTWAAPILYTQ